ncbi:MAG: hypothetical protein ACI4QT_07105 [Kiritimatiellia bacterium]
MVTIKVDTSGATAKLRTLASRLGPRGRSALNQGAAAELSAVTRAHVRAYTQTHHFSAHRLGATPTGHLESAAASIIPASDERAAWCTITAAGITRALHPLTIVPRRARALTIPVSAAAYGRRVFELSRETPIFRIKDMLARDGSDGKPEFLYALKQRVVVPRDPTLLPEQSKLSEAALRGYKAVIARIVAARAAGGTRK